MPSLANDDETPPAGFGFALALAMLCAAAIARWRLGLEIASGVLVAASLTTLLTYTLFAGARQPIFRIFGYLTTPIRWTVSALVLTIVYYALITPIGLCLKWCGRGFVRQRQNETKSNWHARRETPKHDRYFDTY
ncbi:MAG: hypothetical protein AAFU85_16445 [Planctomycetota bacterium]